MIIHDVVQGTDEWLRIRSGIPTASNFEKILTKSGKKSASQEKYMFALLAERMMGHPRFEYMSAFMQRGTELEAKAVAKYEMMKDTDTFPIGFVTNDAQTVGASPDRGVGDRGLLEVKVPKDETHAMYLLGSGSVFDEYRVQAYGQLWVAGKDWTDVISFHPEMPAAIVHTEHDEPFIKLLEEAVMEFSAKLEAKALELAEKGWLTKPAPAFSPEVDEQFERWQKTGVI
jgi:hypothetical protein